MGKPLTILFLAANPVNAGHQLRLDREYREIGDKIRAAPYRDSIRQGFKNGIGPRSRAQRAPVKQTIDVVGNSNITIAGARDVRVGSVNTVTGNHAESMKRHKGKRRHE